MECLTGSIVKPKVCSKINRAQTFSFLIFHVILILKKRVNISTKLFFYSLY